MKEFILLVKEFEGIFGAVLGSITTLIATDILRKKGNLKVYLMDWKGKYETFKEVGCYMGEKKDTDFYHYTF